MKDEKDISPIDQNYISMLSGFASLGNFFLDKDASFAIIEMSVIVDHKAIRIKFDRDSDKFTVSGKDRNFLRDGAYVQMEKVLNNRYRRIRIKIEEIENATN